MTDLSHTVVEEKINQGTLAVVKCWYEPAIFLFLKATEESKNRIETERKFTNQ